MLDELNDLMRQARTLRLHSILSQKGLLTPLDVALVGATGVGKSSTLNALFGSDVAEVGTGCEPQTQVISGYRVGECLRLHDTAGLGDGRQADERHAKNLIELLRRTCTAGENRYYLVDLVLVILDGGSRDLGTSYKLLTDVILPNIEPSRVLVVINKADVAMSGRYWDFDKSEPQPRLLDFLDEKVHSTQARIKEATGLSIAKPIYYSADHDYHVDRLFEFMLDNLPNTRRHIR